MTIVVRMPIASVFASSLCIIHVVASMDPDWSNSTLTSVEVMLTDTHKAFSQFKYKLNRIYASPAEEKERFSAFKANLAEMVKLQRQQEHATFSVNELSDYTMEELGFLRCGISRKASASLAGMQKPPVKIKNTYWDGRCTSCSRFPELTSGLPIDPKTKLPGWDWQEHGAVTTVKTQGGGSGWGASGAWERGG